MSSPSNLILKTALNASSVAARATDLVLATVMEITVESPRDIISFKKLVKHLAFTDLRDDVYEKIREAFTTLALVYHIFGMDRPLRGELRGDSKVKTLKYDLNYYKKFNSSLIRCLFFLMKNGQEKWVDYLKYITLSFYAFYETENTDPVPVLSGIEEDHRPQVLFGGAFASFLFFLKKKKKRFASFILTINMAKMGLPRPTEDMVAVKTFETAKFLTSPPRPLPDPEYIIHRDWKGHLHGSILNKELIVRELIRIIREVFKGVVFTRDQQFEPFCPSTSSNYNYTRSEAGCVGAIVEDIIERYNLQTEEQLLLTETKEVTASDYRVISSTFNGKDDDFLNNSIRSPNEEMITAVMYDDRVLREKWEEAMVLIHRDARLERPIVKPVGLSEALKVRVISKGPPLLYTYLKPFQKFMHSHMRKMRVFQLIGRPSTADIVNRTFKEHLVQKENQFLNGDYKASTDNLRGWVSETLAIELVKVLAENRILGDNSYEIDQDLLIRSLTGHIFEMENGSYSTQKDGQLMGSISSFPFLCLANAALCRLALEWTWGKKFLLTDIPLLVNGDDCTLCGPRDEFVVFRNIWEKITNFAGLTSSQGKTLFSLPSRPIVVINSMTFDWDVRNSCWKERKFVPLGIMLNKPRSGATGVAAERQYSELGALHRQLFHMSPSFVWTEVSSIFVKNVEHILRRCPSIPWYTPEYLGGPGLMPLFRDKAQKVPEVSSYDLKLFTFMIMHLNRSDVIQPTLALKPTEWKFHDYVRRSYGEIKETTFLFTEEEGQLIDMEEEASKLYRLKTVEALFRNSTSKLYERNEFDKKQAYLVNRRSELANIRFHALMQKRMLHRTDIKVRKWDHIVQFQILKNYPVLGSYYDPKRELFHQEVFKTFYQKVLEFHGSTFRTC